MRALLLLMLLTACAPLGDDAGDPPVDTFEAPDEPEHGVQIHLDAGMLAGGDEMEKCRFFKANNFLGGMVERIELHARPGLHHALLVTLDNEQDDEEMDCFGLPDDAMSGAQVPRPIYASSTQVNEEVVEFPDGVGIPFDRNTQLMLNYHYLNLTEDEMAAEVYINLHYAPEDEADDLEEAGFYSVGNITGIDVPAGGTQTLSTSCLFPEGTHLVSLTPHMHQRGTDFEARFYDGVPGDLLYEGGSWTDSATKIYDPPVAFGAEQGLNFSCTFDNPTGNDLSFGQTSDDEMCFAFGFYYPSVGFLYRADYDEACTTE